MSKVIVNGEEVVPAKKVKLDQHMRPSDIKKMIKDKSLEQRNEKPQGN